MSLESNALNSELNERLELIESMIAEGRRRTRRWGWSFVLWGIAYFVAIFWAAWSIHPFSWPTSLLGQSCWAWPVTMLGSCILTFLLGTRKGQSGQEPNTLAGSAIGAIWSMMGVSMILIFPALSMAGKMDSHAFVALVASFLGMANGASSIILKWREQMACAGCWWLTSVAVCFVSEAQVVQVFLGAIFLCQIVFGLYAMSCEARANREVRHA
jgi:hypothetical protein